MFDDTASGVDDRFADARGAQLAAVVEGTDPRTLSGHELVEFIAAAERLSSWASAEALRGIAELAVRRPGAAITTPPTAGDYPVNGQINEFADLEVANALRLSQGSAATRVALAVELRALPAVFAALHAGALDVPRAKVIADALVPLDDATAVAIAEAVLVTAPDQTRNELKKAIDRAVLAVDPDASQGRHERAVEDRRVMLFPESDGIASIWALLPADQAVAVYTALTGLADQAKSPDDMRTMDQRRADALGDLAFTVLDNFELPTRQRRRPHLQVTMAASTALGLDEQPGELGGYGPIPASMARQIAGDATWRRILTDDVSGILLDYGTTTYSAPASLAAFVIARDGVCCFPGCRQAAVRCDLDHEVAFPGGPTAAANLHPLCRHHHRAKTEGGWGYTTDADGNLIWTSPTGHTRIRPPHVQLGQPPPTNPVVPMQRHHPPPDECGQVADARPASDGRCTKDDVRPIAGACPGESSPGDDLPPF